MSFATLAARSDALGAQLGRGGLHDVRDLERPEMGPAALDLEALADT